MKLPLTRKKSKKIEEDFTNSTSESTKNSTRQKQSKSNKKDLKSSQNAIKYVAMHENGLCQVDKNHYSMTYVFNDMNYSIASYHEQQKTTQKYMEIINSIDDAIKVQLTLNNKFLDIEDFEEKMLNKEKNDGIDLYRNEINEIMLQNASVGINKIVRERFMTLTIKSDNYQNALREFIAIENIMSTQFREMGSNFVRQTGIERLDYLNQFLNNEPLYFNYDSLIIGSGMTTKDFICPEEINAKNSEYLKINDTFVKTVLLREISNKVKDSLLKELTDLAFDISVNIHYQAYDEEGSKRKVRTTISSMEQVSLQKSKQAAKDGLSGVSENAYGSPSAIIEREAAYQVFSELEDNAQKMFGVTFLITCKGKTKEELDARLKDVTLLAKKNSIKLVTIPREQLAALNSVLPIGFDHLNYKYTLLSKNLATMVPFSAVEYRHPNGVYYGMNQISSNMIIMNRKKLSNGNGLYLGQPGGGKSVLAKWEMMNVRCKTDDTIIYVDPEGEGDNLIQAYGGQIIKLSQKSEYRLNPLDLSLDYDADNEGGGDPIKAKTEFIISMLEIMICDNGNTITKEETSIIDRAARKMYTPYLAGQVKETPTLTDLHKIILEQEEDIAKGIATRLEPYVGDGVYSMFDCQTNVDIKNQFISYNIKELPNGAIKNVGMLIVLDQIWSRMSSNRDTGTSTWIYIDEMYLMFQQDSSADFLWRLWKRARKWGGIPTGITQNIEDMLANEKARSMLSNCSTLVIMKQGAKDALELANLLDLSEIELGYIEGATVGKGVLVIEKDTVIPFSNIIPSKYEVFKLVNTNLHLAKNDQGQF